MEKVAYQVFVPPALEELIGFGFKNFNNEKIEDARNAALEYLSAAIVQCVREKRIVITEIDSEPVDISEEQFWLTPIQLNFPKLLEMKIDYIYGDSFNRFLLRVKSDQQQQFLLSQLGFFSLGMLIGGRKFKILNFTNDSEHNYGENWIFRTYDMNIEFPPLITVTPYHKCIERRKMEKIITEKSLFNKIIVREHNFLKFERDMLSVMNSEGYRFYIFSPAKQKHIIDEIIEIIKNTYSFDYDKNETKFIETGGEKFYVTEYTKNGKKLYLKNGDLYLRDDKGAFLCNDETTFEEVLNIFKNTIPENRPTFS